jgi:hypothetical protein
LTFTGLSTSICQVTKSTSILPVCQVLCAKSPHPQVHIANLPSPFHLVNLPQRTSSSSKFLNKAAQCLKFIPSLPTLFLKKALPASKTFHGLPDYEKDSTSYFLVYLMANLSLREEPFQVIL